MKLCLHRALLFVCMALSWNAARAADAQVKTDNVLARVVSEYNVIQPGQELAVMLHQTIRSGWHTYWVNPGDSGEPTTLDWQLPESATAGGIQWPTPQAIKVGPLVNYGYSDAVGLISMVTVPADWPVGKPFEFTVDAKWLVCEAECIPESGQFTLSIPTAASNEVTAVEKPLFAAVRATQPVPATFATALSSDTDEVVLHIALPEAAAKQVIAAQFFPDQWGVVNHAAAQSFAVDSAGVRITTLKGELPAPAIFSGIVTLTEQRGAQQVHSSYLIGADSAALVPAAAVPASIIIVLLSALAGGLLLNLMPCVFPILAMKALAFVSHAAAPTRERVTGGLAYTAGVLMSFAALGAVLLLLKAGGNAVGWGFQLQNPILVTVLAYVLFVAGLNLSGMFAVGGGFMGAGSELAARAGISGSFFTGVLAAVVATPCTAPFMATAVGVAMTQSPSVAMTTFITLGLGLALPYLALTVFPALARRMPKPGAWMNTLKQALAFPLYVSAAWLVWVLAQQSGANGVFVALLGMIMLAFAIWLGALPGTGSNTKGAGRVLRLSGSAVAVVLSLVLASSMQTEVTASPQQSTDIDQPYARERFDAARAAGQPLFVNMTAAWCVTCKVNERVALSGAAFHQALQEGGYTYFKGDWTNQNPEITQLLSNFGRAGVPLYVVYPAQGGAPIVLPQLLTESIVVEALKANGGAPDSSST